MRYPVYVPSKGRPYNLTGRMLREAGIPFLMVVEPQDLEAYRTAWGLTGVLVLPEAGRGLAFSRSWIKRTSEFRGEARHWQLDDDVRRFIRRDPTRVVDPRDALRWAEDLTDSYEKVGVLGIASQQWPYPSPVQVNRYAYITILVQNGTPFYWPENTWEDGDFVLQCLQGGYPTLVIKAYRHVAAPINAGAPGGLKEFYAKGEQARLFKAFTDRWPGVVTLTAKGQKRIRWSAFDPPLVRIRENPSALESGL